MKVERYMTKGIGEKIPEALQLQLWELQSNLKAEFEKQGKTIDYLQVYELKILERNDERIQVIIHRSEKPKYEKIYYIEGEEPVVAKIYIIQDDYGDVLVETILLSEEY